MKNRWMLQNTINKWRTDEDYDKEADEKEEAEIGKLNGEETSEADNFGCK